MQEIVRHGWDILRRDILRTQSNSTFQFVLRAKDVFRTRRSLPIRARQDRMPCIQRQIRMDAKELHLGGTSLSQ
jgi:hypothetical protein